MLKVSPNYFPNESSAVSIINKSRNKADMRNHIIDDREKNIKIRTVQCLSREFLPVVIVH